MRKFNPVVLLAIFFGLAGTAASAATNNIIEPSQLVAGFTEICLKNLGDQTSQKAAAQGKPWQLVTQIPDYGEERLRSDAFALGINASGGKCALTAELRKSASLQDVESAFIKETGADEPQSLAEPDSVYWMIAAGPDGTPYAVGLKVSATSGGNLATLAVSRSKGNQ